MRNNTRPNTSKNTTMYKKKPKKSAISINHISLLGGKQIKMNFTKWVMFLTLLGILILSLMTYPNRLIRHNISNLESKKDINTYCKKKNLNCTYTVLADYDIKGFQVARVAFLPDDFFGTVEPSVETGSGATTQKTTKPKKNVYITIQKGQSVEIPE